MSALTQVACPQCGTGNRIASGHDATDARCGRCSETLFPAAPIDVDDAAFENHLNQTRGRIVLDVWAPWCGPCRTMAPHFADAALRLAGEAVFLKMNADQCKTPARLGVRGIPALFLFDNGKFVASRAGMMTAQGLVDWIAQTRSMT